MSTTSPATGRCNLVMDKDLCSAHWDLSHEMPVPLFIEVNRATGPYREYYWLRLDREAKCYRLKKDNSDRDNLADRVEYTIALDFGACNCPDQRCPQGSCKHTRALKALVKKLASW